MDNALGAAQLPYQRGPVVRWPATPWRQHGVATPASREASAIAYRRQFPGTETMMLAVFPEAAFIERAIARLNTPSRR